MIQAFFIAEIYMVVGGLLLMMDAYRDQLSFLLRFRAFIQEKKGMLNLYFAIGIISAALLLFFPVSPGPIILGDLIPAFTLIILSFHFRVEYSEENREKERVFRGTKLGKARLRGGIISIAIAIVHFIIPSFVLL